MQKKYIKDKLGNIVFPFTHTSSVIDNDGGTLEESLLEKTLNDLILVEAIASLLSRIEYLELYKNILVDAKAKSIDTEDLPKVVGEDIIIIKDSIPTIVPKFIGQIYFDSKNLMFYIAKLITNSVKDWSRSSEGIENIISLAFALINARLVYLEEALSKNIGSIKAKDVDSENFYVCGNSVVLKGEGAPAVVPTFVGLRYLDITNNISYTAYSVTNSTGDWHLD